MFTSLALQRVRVRGNERGGDGPLGPDDARYFRLAVNRFKTRIGGYDNLHV
jgi:hypothetical protein